MTKSRCECIRNSGSIPGVGQKFISSRHCPARNRLPSSVLFSRYGGNVSLGVKRLGHEADRSSPSIAKVKNECSFDATALISAKNARGNIDLPSQRNLGKYLLCRIWTINVMQKSDVTRQIMYVLHCSAFA